MIFDCSVAGDFVSQHIDCFVIRDAEGFVAVGIGDSVAEGFLQSGAEHFDGTFMADFVHCHLHFCKWGNAVPMSFFLWLVWALSWFGELLQYWVVLLF